MKTSKRMKRLPAPYLPAFLAMADRLAEQGFDVIHLGHDTPDLPTPKHIVEALEAAAGRGHLHRDDSGSGKPELKEAICAWYRSEHGAALDPETEVAVVPGIRAGLIRLAAILLDPGDAALVPDPGPPEYAAGIALAGAAAMPMPLRKDYACLPDLEAIPLSRRVRAKLMYLNYPSNPLGVCAPATFFDDAIRFALKYDIVIAHDFAYGAVGFDGRKPVSFLSRPGAKEAGIEWYSLSIPYNLPGWQIGFAAGNKRVIRLLNMLQQQGLAGVPEAVQDAAITALRSSQECVRESARIYESRRNALFRDMDKIGWHAAPSEGSLFAWLPIPAGYSSFSFANLVLRKAQVALAPGNAFGESGEGYVRLGLLTSEERLREAMRRIQALSLF